MPKTRPPDPLELPRQSADLQSGKTDPKRTQPGSMSRRRRRSVAGFGRQTGTTISANPCRGQRDVSGCAARIVVWGRSPWRSCGLVRSGDRFRVTRIYEFASTRKACCPFTTERRVPELSTTSGYSQPHPFRENSRECSLAAAALDHPCMEPRHLRGTADPCEVSGKRNVRREQPGCSFAA